MGSRLSITRAVVLAAVAALCVAVVSAVAASSARAITIDAGRTAGNTLALAAVSCPTADQCTAVDNGGHAVTYSPRVPHRINRITLGRCGLCTDLVGVDCPSAHQCTAASQLGGTYTFSPRGRAHIHHGAYGPVSAIACPSTSECVLLNGSGSRRTIDPRRPRSKTVAQPISAGVGLAIACPTTAQCTNVASAASTFDPRTPPATPPMAAPDFPIGISPNISAIDCPTRHQCTAVNFGGSAATFNPGNPTAQPRVRGLGHHDLTSVTCPSAHECTAVDSTGATLSFDPDRAHGRVRHRRSFKEGDAVDCVDTSTCSVVGGQFEVYFDPR